MSAAQKNKDLLERFSPGGLEHIERNVAGIFPDLAEHLIEDIYGFAYRRGEISIETRHLLSLAVIGAMGGCENQLDFQLRAALNLGIPPTEIREVFIQIAVFAGNARAINAAAIFKKILDERLPKDEQ
jgi:4-carboxymuconolactone decarboxylase